MHAYSNVGVSYVYIPIPYYAYSLLSLPTVSLVCFADLYSLASTYTPYCMQAL